jgi:hypothetical protein
LAIEKDMLAIIKSHEDIIKFKHLERVGFMENYCTVCGLIMVNNCCILIEFDVNTHVWSIFQK